MARADGDPQRLGGGLTMARSESTAASVYFPDIDQARSWFERQPREVAVTMAARAALRILPLIVTGPPNQIRRRNLGDVVLTYFRGAAVSWASAKFPVHAAELRKPAGDAANASIALYNSTAAAAVAARGALNTVAASVTAAAVTAAFSGRAADALQWAAAILPVAADAAAFDASFIESGRSPGARAVRASELAGFGLWPASRGVPTETSEAWTELKSSLLAAGEDWEVWTDWYEDRVLGRQTDPELQIARTTLPGELWEEGPKAVNAEIRRLIEAHTSAEPIPAQGSGPHFDLSSAHRITLAATSEIDVGGNNLSRLRQQLPLVREAADDLASRLNPNAFPELARNIVAYRAALAGEPEAIAWGVVFARGVRLDNAASAARRQVEDRLQPPLEDAAQEALESVFTLHGPMILATAEGRDLMGDADRMVLTREQQAAQRADALTIAAALDEDREVIEPPAAEIVLESVETMGEGPHPERGSVVGSAAIRNVTIWAVGIGAIAAIAGVGFLEAGAAVIAIEGLKKSKRFSALTDALGTRIDGVLRTGTAFQNFVIRNEQPLRQIASTSTGMRWMLPYIDDVVRRNADKSPASQP
jgi:hypothetical protein